MFERTFSFWKRLVGGSPAPASQEDRRLWARFQANITTRAHAVPNGEASRLAVKVRDISRGGANLFTERPFEEGSMVSLELPSRSAGAVNEVLACVVRVVPEIGGFAVGCVFSQELSEADLEGFGARKMRPQPEDQRRWMRFQCEVTARVQKVGVDDGDIPAKVIDLSPTGVGLRVDQPLEPGTLLNMDLCAADGHLVRSILACVVHINGQVGTEWNLGCNFIRELDVADMEALV